MKTSNYVIYVHVPEGDKYYVVHGYSGKARPSRNGSCFSSRTSTASRPPYCFFQR